MTRILLSAFIGLLFLAGCSDSQETSTPTSSVVALASYDVFGDGFDQVDAVPVQQVASNPSDYLGSPVKVSGTITQVCQGMGCWMTLRVSDTQLVRIVMPRDDQDNYLFTLAKDISGRRAVIMGTLDESTLAEFEAPMHQDGDSEGHHADEYDEGEHHAEGQEADDDHHAEEEEADDDHSTVVGLELHITASGVLVEKPDEATDASVETTD